MIVDAGEDIAEVGLWIKAVHLGGFNDGHGARKGFGAAVRRCK